MSQMLRGATDSSRETRQLPSARSSLTLFARRRRYGGAQRRRPGKAGSTLGRMTAALTYDDVDHGTMSDSSGFVWFRIAPYLPDTDPLWPAGPGLGDAVRGRPAPAGSAADAGHEQAHDADT